MANACQWLTAEAPLPQLYDCMLHQCCACASHLRWWEQQTPRHDPNSPGAVVLSDANDFNGAEHWLVVLAGCLVTDA